MSRKLARVTAPLLALAVVLAPAQRVDAARNETLVTPSASAYELVIVEVEGCIYCEVLRRDVMPAFNASPQAKELMVRFLDLNTPEAKKLELTDGPLTTVPTVLLVKANREVGRAAGYMGPEGFFHSIKWMMNHAE
ncbi:MAG: hypothetical protein ABL901_13410 [Hyphomicrobiaceae bacterium]